MNVIAVDDELFALRSIERVIAKVIPDCNLSCFNLPSEAILHAQENQVDVAFLDIEMGGINGLELAKNLKEIHGKTNIIFVTGYSEYAVDAFTIFASGYILKPVSAKAIDEALKHLRNPIVKNKNTDTGLRVQTFGNFEVFLDGRPVHFARSKAKEMFAYLIHKRGTGASSKELAAVLFEHQPYSTSTQKQIQTILSVMLKTLKKAGAGDVIVRGHNSTAVDVPKINCDYYRFLKWDLDVVNEYIGEYMSNYSWAEFAIGYLDSKVL